MHLPGIGPGGKPGHDVELLEELADDLIRVTRRAEAIELGHDARECLLDIADGAFGVVLPLLVQAALTAHELFTIETGQGMEDGLARRAGVDQEARQTVP